jgi:hypothetical protein
MSVVAELIYGATPFELEDSFQVTDGGDGELDELAVDYFCAFPGYKAELTAAGITKYDPYPDAAGFWVTNLRAKKEGSGRCVVSVSCAGMSGGFAARRRRTISAFGQVVSIGPIERVILVTALDETGKDPETGAPVEVRRREAKLDGDGEVVYKTISTPSGTGERWNIAEAGIRVTDVYFATSAPTMTVVKTAMAPPSAPAVPTSPWGSYGEAMRFNHPNGWVLDDRQLEEVVTGKLWRVTDVYGHYLMAVPD